MTEPKFTPGPWAVEEDWNTDRDINGHVRGDEYIAGFDITSKDTSIVTCEGISGSGSTERANAHLIAAAPDLYQALSDLVSSIETEHVAVCLSQEIAIARAALAKARGDSAKTIGDGE